jgi:hypothetical protein
VCSSDFVCVCVCVCVCVLFNFRGIALATKEIFDGSQGKHNTQQEIKRKQQTIKHLCKKYESRQITTDEIEYCLYSITDNNRYTVLTFCFNGVTYF